jgi:hypothetical protein
MFISDFHTLAEPADITVLAAKNNFLAAIRQVKSTTPNQAIWRSAILPVAGNRQLVGFAARQKT